MIMKKSFYYILLLIISALFYSCSSTEGNEPEFGQSNAVLISPGELKAKINEESAKLTSLNCEGSISIDTPELNSSGSITVSINKPDSIFTKIEGPFGISIADVLITRNNFIYYNIRENTVIKGSSNTLNLGAILRLKLCFDDLINGYSCSFTFPDTTSGNSELSYDKNLYLLKISGEQESKFFWVNPKFYYIEKYEIKDKSNNTKLKIEYSDFSLQNNIYTPENVSISNPNEKQNLWLTLNKKAFNTNRLKFKLRFPKSAKIIVWE